MIQNKIKPNKFIKLNQKERKNKIKTYLQYMILKTPAKTRGNREMVPFFSSTLSIIKIATIDVKATVICFNKCNNKDS